MWTPPHSSMMERMSRPLVPMRALCSRAGMATSTSAMLARSFWMDRMRLRAASQLARLPVMTMVSELLFSAGRSILVLLSSRIFLMLAPPFPMMFL